MSVEPIYDPKTTQLINLRWNKLHLCHKKRFLISFQSCISMVGICNRVINLRVTNCLSTFQDILLFGICPESWFQSHLTTFVPEPICWIKIIHFLSILRYKIFSTKYSIFLCYNKASFIFCCTNYWIYIILIYPSSFLMKTSVMNFNRRNCFRTIPSSLVIWCFCDHQKRFFFFLCELIWFALWLTLGLQ